jgi:hypothetical protein
MLPLAKGIVGRVSSNGLLTTGHRQGKPGANEISARRLAWFRSCRKRCKAPVVASMHGFDMNRTPQD